MINRLVFGLGMGLSLWSVPVMAQVASNPVGAKSDWTIYVEDNPKQCWVVALPQAGKSSATRDGRPVAVKRGDISLFVSFWPKGGSGGGNGEVSFRGGYEFAESEPVTVQIGDRKFELFTNGETAWAMSGDQDRQIAQAMKAGAEAVITGVSKRSGTTTKDTFSLKGFTAAFEDAQRRCAK